MLGRCKLLLRPPGPASLVTSLRAQLRACNHAYYNNARPLLSDSTYDALFHRLLELEEAHPDLRSPDSPTQTVGAASASGSFEATSFKHKRPMLSLRNVTCDDDVLAFDKSIKSSLGMDADSALRYALELKYDGVAVDVRYHDELPLLALSRGDGRVGEDVTANLLASVPGLPQPDDVGGALHVRGEVVMRKELAPPGTSTRNTAAGLMRRQDLSKERVSYPLDLQCYEVVSAAAELPHSHMERLEWLAGRGFSVDAEARVYEGVDALLEALAERSERRADMAFDVDGFVIKLDDTSMYESLGATSRAPRWAVAFKFPPASAWTRLQDVAVQIGRSGRATPVAYLDPVALGGAVITRASLHTFGHAMQLGLARGCEVLVERRGDVVPHITAAVRGDGEHEDFSFDKLCCPCVHQSPIGVRDDGKHWYCQPPAGTACVEAAAQRLSFFVSKHGIDVDGLGARTMRLLIEHGLVKSESDVFRLAEQDAAKMAEVPGLGERSVGVMLAAIEEAKRNLTPAKLLAALGIDHVGKTTAERMLAAFGNDLEAVMRADADEVEAKVDGVGGKAAQALAAYVEENGEMLERDLLPLVKGAKSDAVGKGDSFSVVLTGKFEGVGSRAELAKRIEAAGGKVASSVGPKTLALVRGVGKGGASRKEKQAQARGVAVWSIEELLEYLRVVKEE